MRWVAMCLLACSLVGATALVLGSSTTNADDLDPINNPTTTTVAGPVITAVVTVPGGQDPGGPPVTVEVPCSWFGFVASDEDADRYNEITQDLIDIINDIVNINLVMTITYYSEDGLLHRWNDRIGDFEQHQIADCTARRPPTVSSPVTVAGSWSGRRARRSCCRAPPARRPGRSRHRRQRSARRIAAR